MSLTERVLEFGRRSKGAARLLTLGIKDTQVVASGRPFTPEQLLRYVRDAEEGDTRYLHAFFDEMRATDAHLDGELSKAEDYLTGARFDVLPYPPRLRGPSQKSKREAKRATEIAAFVEENLFAPNVRIDRAIAALADGYWKGVGGFEVVSEGGGGGNGKERLVEFVQIPSQRFRYLPRTTTLALQLTEDEQKLTPVDQLGSKVVYLVADPEVPSPGRRGLLRRCLGLWLIRKYGAQQWSRYVETYGSPLRVGKFQQGDTAMQGVIVEALKKMGSAAWAAIPDGAAIELIESTARATGNPPHEILIDWAAREMSKVILGATQTADVSRGTGSRASAQVHHDVTIARSGARAVHIASALREQLIRPLVERTYGEEIARLYTPELKIRVESKPDVYNASQAIRMLMNAGMTTIPISYVHDFLSIPVPDPDEACLTLPLLPGVIQPGVGVEDQTKEDEPKQPALGDKVQPGAEPDVDDEKEGADDAP